MTPARDTKQPKAPKSITKKINKIMTPAQDPKQRIALQSPPKSKRRLYLILFFNLNLNLNAILYSTMYLKAFLNMISIIEHTLKMV